MMKQADLREYYNRYLMEKQHPTDESIGEQPDEIILEELIGNLLGVYACMHYSSWENYNWRDRPLVHRRSAEARSADLLKAIKNINEERAFALLLMNYYSSTEYRPYVAQMLGHFGKRAIQPLMICLNDEDGDVVYFALSSLKALRANEAIPRIEDLTPSDKAYHSSRQQIKQVAEYAQETIESLSR